MPSPVSDETRKEFLDRCMSDPGMVTEYPDEAHRFAASSRMWSEGARDVSPEDTSQIVKVDDERKVAYGWASVIEDNGETVFDHQDDAIGEQTLLTAAHKFMVDARSGKVMHRGVRVADVVESVVFTKDLQDALGIDLGKVGWFIAMKIRSDEVWKMVKDGKLRAFSIGGAAVRKPV